MQRKIMIFAYTNFNLGDDLFIKVLCERYPETEFLLYAPYKYNKIFEELSNVTIFPRDNFLVRSLNLGMRILKLNVSIKKLIANRCKAIIHIGGSIFMQSKNWNGIAKDKQNKANKPYYVLGANFGPFSDQKFYKAHYKLFKEYTDICFRDNYSYELFKNLSNVRVADDIVFQLHKQQPSISKYYIVISVIKPSIRNDLVGYDEIYYQRIKDLTEYFVQKGYQITLMSFCEKEGDQVAVEEIFRMNNDRIKNNVHKYYYKFNIEEALNVIEYSSYVIATRFHAMILGWVYSKPVFPISYSEKMNNVMSDLEYKGSYINLKEISDLTPEEVYKGMQTNYVDVSQQAKNAENHFKELDKYLMKHS